MAAELRNLKGTGDYLPREQRVRQDIIQRLREVFERYGYRPLETPVLGYFDVLASKYAGGAEILKEVYKLNDQGGRELGLRYDLTVPFARVVGMNPDLRMPFKRYEIGKVYRDGPVKTGRNREFTQCDVDMVGIKSVLAEAELMRMAVEIYQSLGLDVFISYNNRKLLSGLIESAGINSDAASDVILSIDKLGKIGKSGVETELISLGIEAPKIDKLFKSMELKSDELSPYVFEQSNELIRQGMDELNELNSYIDALGIGYSLRFCPSLARGLEIYTGTVWEVFLADGSITSSVGAGGRYDKIIGAFLDNGTDYPAVGMTFGLDVIYEALRQKGAVCRNAPSDIYLIPLGTEKACIRLVTELRSHGLKADFEMSGRKLKKSLDYANKEGIPYVLIIGENELESGKARLKDMKNGSETEIGLDNLSLSISQIVGS